ncbi:F0F1 ATP synthase subunit A [Alkaliphilus hydrothermalis]|uniref:ATP synthase subunit a n=1 Tax=Alkaliphilus hydrothermalis TaxID=1482730 RepID=A0ABS2NQD5_9FIRM|nr:F0F1 ATP synthase subunit A [Alkaliphilus hydrothermalis]MBM7615124.1 F-type H+-transporting ATPase subunit a [Alkaliphilus hydrothermalis]
MEGAEIIFTLPILGIPVSETVVNTWIIMGVLTLFAIVSTRSLNRIPKGMQNVAEAVVDLFNNFTADTMGEQQKGFSPYMGSLALLLLFANLAGLFGLRPPTADLNTTFALATMTFLIIHLGGMKKKGIKGYLKNYIEPFPAMLPLNIIGELAFPVSLAFRLFGNVVAGALIITLLYGALQSLSGMLGITIIPVFQAAIPIVFHLYFDLFSGVLQTFIFVMLSMVFISMAVE